MRTFPYGAVFSAFGCTAVDVRHRYEVLAPLGDYPRALVLTDAEGLVKSKAFVVLGQGQQATADELKAFVKQRLAAYKYPRFIEFVDELPKTATGKIQRFRLREREAGG